MTQPAVLDTRPARLRRPGVGDGSNWGVPAALVVLSIVLGFTAIRPHDIAAHRAWMVRDYALGVGAGTQVFTQGIGEALFGTSDLSAGLPISSAWVINPTVAEWVIRRPARSTHSRAGLAASP